MGGLRIFVSYAREDRAVVEQVAIDLRNLGHDVWFDEQLLGGTDWWQEILRRIRGAHVFLFAISPSSVASVPCLTELGYADRTLRRLLPVTTPDGEQGYQPSRMWVVEGPRWLLRGILYGQAALEDHLDPPVAELLTAFREVVVRRGEEAKSPGDLLPLVIPPDVEPGPDQPED